MNTLREFIQDRKKFRAVLDEFQEKLDPTNMSSEERFIFLEYAATAIIGCDVETEQRIKVLDFLKDKVMENLVQIDAIRELENGAKTH